MSATSTIEWTEATWNPVTGCTKVSPGCDHCYAERITERFHGPGSFEKVELHPDRLDMPLRWRKPRLVFVNSMSDLFHDDVPDEFIERVFAVMSQAPRHTFQVLTKRPGRMASLVARATFIEQVQVAAEALHDDPDDLYVQNGPWPLDNVWLGTSVETQKWADVRIPKLLQTPAAVRFLSCEPLLGPIDLSAWVWSGLNPTPEGAVDLVPRNAVRDDALDWVIGGGESGPGARPMHPDWARALRDECVEADVPFFFKQWGEWVPPGQFDMAGWDDVVMTERGLVLDADGRSRPPHMALSAPDSELVWRVGKKAAGRDLDGRTWDELPERSA